MRQELIGCPLTPKHLRIHIMTKVNLKWFLGGIVLTLANFGR